MNIPNTHQKRVVIVGGGFGGKNDSFDLDFCATFLSKKTGKPVKIAWSQKDVLTSGRRRHHMIVDLKTGVKKDGTLVAIDCKTIADGGAYTCTGPITMYLAGVMLGVPYRLPNLKFDGLRVYTNKPAGVALRGVHAPAGADHRRLRGAVVLRAGRDARWLRRPPADARARARRHGGRHRPS